MPKKKEVKKVAEKVIDKIADAVAVVAHCPRCGGLAHEPNENCDAMVEAQNK